MFCKRSFLSRYNNCVISYKSQCMVFKPNRFKLYCPAVYLNGNIIDYAEKTKYLGYMFTNDKQDDVEMLRQFRLLYMRSNKIIRMFYLCTIDVKLELFRSFCTSFYCCYLWTGYKKSTFNRLRVAFNNAYRRILDLPWRCSASGMYATYSIYNLEAIIRKQTFGFIGRLRKSCNTIVQTLENAWIIRIQLWHTWFEVLYTNRWYIWWQYASMIFVFYAINFIIKYLYFISICNVFLYCITM